MTRSRVTIIGGGLAGLYAATLLEQRGVTDYVLLEARTEVGGRILAAPASRGSPQGFDRVDLGPTWYWPDFQPELDALVRALGLAMFAQPRDGDVMIERAPNAVPQRLTGSIGASGSTRLAGGMAALIEALASRVDAAQIRTDRIVHALRVVDDHVELDMRAHDGTVTTHATDVVLLAVPPRLAAQSIQFEPALPETFAETWRHTATWMAPHAKYVAVYDESFWRRAGLSGMAQSAVGPLTEIHDASMPGGSAALFGFFGVPARVRQRVSEDVLRAHCRAQLGRLFGPEAAAPRMEIIKDWAADPLTATTADLDASAGHGMAPPAIAASGPWRGRLVGVASEWSPQHPGYLAGAVEAARLGVVQAIGTSATARENAAKGIER